MRIDEAATEFERYVPAIGRDVGSLTPSQGVAAMTAWYLAERVDA